MIVQVGQTTVMRDAHATVSDMVLHDSVVKLRVAAIRGCLFVVLVCKLMQIC